MAGQKIGIRRNKPRFLRKDWHKKVKLGSSVKKKRKWRSARGRHNKIRLGRKGHSRRPKVGWGASSAIRGLVRGVRAVRVENLKELELLSKGDGIIIGSVGRKKREEISAKAKKMGLKILNKYRKKTPSGEEK